MTLLRFLRSAYSLLRAALACADPAVLVAVAAVPVLAICL